MDIFAAAYRSIKPRYDDDFADRVNYYFTSSAFLFFALILTARQWIGQPIECWVPAEFKRAWEQYTEDYCFIQNTYWIPIQSSMPDKSNERISRHLGYYQWVPFILSMEALFFAFPYIVWWLLNWQGGLDINGIVKTAKQETELTPECIDKRAIELATFISQILIVKRSQRGQGRSGRNCCYVTVLYLCVKFLYLINSISQLFVLSYMLTTGRSEKGLGIFIDILWGEKWEQSGIFPRVTMCDFHVRILGSLNSYSVQCVLMVNMFNEKVFLIMWFWVLVLVILNSISFLQWLVLCTNIRTRVEYISKYLSVQMEPSRVQTNFVSTRKFVQYYLHFDGVLLIHKLACHCGDMLTSSVIQSLFQFYNGQIDQGQKETLIGPREDGEQTEMKSGRYNTCDKSIQCITDIE